MNYLSFGWLAMATGLVYAQEALISPTATAAAQIDPLMSLISGGGVTFPSALIISAIILARYTPTLRIKLTYENKPPNE